MSGGDYDQVRSLFSVLSSFAELERQADSLSLSSFNRRDPSSSVPRRLSPSVEQDSQISSTTRTSTSLETSSSTSSSLASEPTSARSSEPTLLDSSARSSRSTPIPSQPRIPSQTSRSSIDTSIPSLLDRTVKLDGQDGKGRRLEERWMDLDSPRLGGSWRKSCRGRGRTSC